jgi:uncharacterized membrane protein YoaK (UPF0700 family)
MEDRTARPALLLAWIAGSVDGLGYLVLFHLFTANMTGNSVTLGTQLGQGYWVPAVRSAFPIPLFLAGVAVGALLRRAIARAGRPPRPVILALEALLLLAFLVQGGLEDRAGGVLADSGTFYALAALATLAMGLQNALPPQVRGHTVRTTYVTGTLTSFAEAAVAWAVRRDRRRRDEARFATMLYGGLWTAYVLGAVASGLAERHWGPVGAALPLAGLGALIALDVTRRAPGASVGP